MILAAGKGTRMRSETAKVLHTALGVPLVSYPVVRALELSASPIVAVLGHQIEAVSAVLSKRHGENAVRVVDQKIPRGTGHAVREGLSGLKGFTGLVLILSGDVPLTRTESLRALVEAARKVADGEGKGEGMAMMTARVPDPTGYGRVVRDTSGEVVRVVEHKDAKPSERAIDEVNAGIYVAPADLLRKATRRLSPKNAQGELYLTDVVAFAAETATVATVMVAPEEMAGVNDRAQLAEVERVLRGRIVSRWMEHATFREPGSAYVDADVVIDAEAEIGRQVTLRGKTRIGRGTRIGDGVVLTDVEVGENVEIKPYSVGEQAIIGAGSKIGPFAHLRPGTVLGADVHIGNFVETKKARLGKGSKANHLTYLGDAEIGDKVNVGAGTITCNYNGYEKRVTVIEDGASIGSDTALVAPVRIGKRAVTGAGSTIARDVPEGALALTRAELVIVDGYADRMAARYADRGATRADGKPGGPTADRGKGSARAAGKKSRAGGPPSTDGI
jgi:bifunctional UDP-N-acetylglucosamine pyrophosphorylase/glucosamine-1-phosphate N-acetyltransferase